MNKSLKSVALSLAAAALMAIFSVSAQAATKVQVSLWDKGADMKMPKGLIYGAPGLDLSKATMGITATPGAVKAGDVTFDVTNDSKDTIHEMIVIFLADPSMQLPYDASEERVDEEAAGDRGEVSELDPGGTGSLTVNLKPGNYLLICNVAGHYAAGMWTEFTVTP